jgi:hypothetical protein
MTEKITYAFAAFSRTTLDRKWISKFGKIGGL